MVRLQAVHDFARQAGNRFQFQNGAIARKADQAQAAKPSPFQFQNGAIARWNSNLDGYHAF